MAAGLIKPVGQKLFHRLFLYLFKSNNIVEGGAEVQKRNQQGLIEEIQAQFGKNGLVNDFFYKVLKVIIQLKNVWCI